MPTPTNLAADPTVDVAIVCTLELESAPIVRRLGRRHRVIGDGFSVVNGWAANRRIAVVRSDRGRKRLMAATDALLSVHRPKWLIAAGFAVGLDDSLKRGSIVVASELVNQDNQLEKTQTPQAVAAAGAGVAVGRLASIASVPRTAAGKRETRLSTGAIAADQYTWFLCNMSGEHGARFLAVRVLVDDAAGDAEPESRAVYHPSATYRAGGMVGAFLRGSGRVGRIWKIRSNAKRYAERLAEFLLHLLPKLT